MLNVEVKSEIYRIFCIIHREGIEVRDEESALMVIKADSFSFKYLQNWNEICIVPYKKEIFYDY